MAEAPPVIVVPSDEWVDRFLTHLRSERGVSPYTERNYRQALVEFQRWHFDERGGATEWRRLERDDFRSYLRFLGRGKLGRAAIQLRFSALRTFYKFLVRHGQVAATPIRNLSLPKLGRRLPKFLTVQQMMELLKAPLLVLEDQRKGAAPLLAEVASRLRDVAILETIYSCGLRVAELCRLRVEDLDFANGMVRVFGKGRKERQVPIGDPALKSIESYWGILPTWPGLKAPVFLANPSRPRALYPRLVQLRLKGYLERSGLDPHLTPHKLRHSYATHLLDAGADLRSVQELLGHAHLVTTQIYAHLTTDRLKSAYNKSHPRA